MDLSKLKLGKLSSIKSVNFPADIDIGSQNSRAPDVLLYFIAKPEDVGTFVTLCRKTKLPTDNRVVMVYRKGNKELNRDTIIAPFRQGRHTDFKLKPPMLCALSETLSAFVLQKV
jgi:selenophosphate synthetase-related protein